MALLDPIWWKTIVPIVQQLDAAQIDYTFIDTASCYLQGVPLSPPAQVEISIQWDLLPRARELFHFIDTDSAADTVADPAGQQAEYPAPLGFQRYCFQYQQLTFALRCYHNTVVVTDPMRYQLTYNGQTIWVKALDFYMQTLEPTDILYQAVAAHLATLQQGNNQHNERIWNHQAYNAWLQRHGTPTESAARLKKDPYNRLSSLTRYGLEFKDKKVINLLGSHGLKAISMALLGASVTIVDIAQGNAQYAQEVAQYAGVAIRYIVSDVLALPEAERDGSYQLVFMEMGILHYFVDLKPLAQLVYQLLQKDGQLFLQDFHPVSTKLITSKGKRHRVSGNYFDPTLKTTAVAYNKHLTEHGITGEEQPVYEREWTLGEIVTAFAQAGLCLERLDEEPNMKRDDIGLPKTFTLLARRP